MGLRNGVKDEKLEYYEGSLKNLVFRGGHEKPMKWKFIFILNLYRDLYSFLAFYCCLKDF